MNDLIAARLELIAAKAKVLAIDYRANKLYPGELSRGLDEILKEISYARNQHIGGSHEA